MFQCEEPCLYLTLNLFTCHSYFLGFIKSHPTFVDLQNAFKKASGICADDVIDLIRAVLATNNSPTVFIDFGKVSAYPTEGDYLHKLYRITTIFINSNWLFKYSLLFAVSSGIYAASHNPKFTTRNKETCRQLQLVMRSVPGLTLTGYTATEVDQMFRYLNVEENSIPRK